MQNIPNTDEQLLNTTKPAQVIEVVNATPEETSPAIELRSLLDRAAALAASLDIPIEGWMKDAWSAYVDARPGFREHLEDMQLLAQLEELRQSGRLGQA